MMENESKIRIGIICPSEIAFRRFLPALKKTEGIEYAGVAVATPEEWANRKDANAQTIETIKAEYGKALKFQEEYGGRIFDGYQNLIESEDIDAVYLPLPPALHFKWAEKTLLAGKHAYVEKPFTTSYEDTIRLLALAKEHSLAVHENYMFIYHRQIEKITSMIRTGDLGKVRLYRISFGFPRRPKGDFRYIRALGGGALLDAGGYCIKLASALLGPSARLEYAVSNYESGCEVDIFGSGSMRNCEGTSVQFAFGMDCDYKCELEAWGSTGTLTTGRILTAPDGFVPEVMIKHNQEYEKKLLPVDNSFSNSIVRFIDCVHNKNIREDNYREIARQSSFVSEFKKLSYNGK